MPRYCMSLARCEACICSTSQLAVFEAAYTLTWWQGALSGCKENVLVLSLVNFEAALTRLHTWRFIRLR